MLLVSVLMLYMSGWLFLRQTPKAWNATLQLSAQRAMSSGTSLSLAEGGCDLQPCYSRTVGRLAYIAPRRDRCAARRQRRGQIDPAESNFQSAGKPQSEILIPLTEFEVHAAEVANKVAAAALTVTGGYGYRRGPIERSFRDARAAIAIGPSNVFARDWIGKSLVGLPHELFYEGGE